MSSLASQENTELLLLAAYRGGVTDPKELANFMGQMQVESQGFSKTHESLNYSAERLLEVFPGRNSMDTLKEAQAIVAGGQEKIAEAIYGGKWGEGIGNKPNSGDSFDFRGRGFVQLTGRSNYEHYGKALGLDLTNHPELAAEPKNAAALAVQYWKERVVSHGLQHDVTSATKGINGGDKGLPERKAAAADWQHKLTPQVMAGLAKGEVHLPVTPVTDKHHPGHALYEQALVSLEKFNAAHGIPSDQSTRNAAAALAVEAHRHGLKHIDHVEPNIGGDKLIAVQGKPGTAHSKMIDMPTSQAMSTPIEDSSKAYLQPVHQAAPQQGQQAHHAQDKPQPAMVQH
ncbi:MAG: hypothetical protein EON54_24960 [Alcaligenaceae bacterium]|nr:MAG: hypothetical protein EON54_24960 [Alcaligenaceae bacterium]